jgi:hypothetical protein
LLRFARNDGGSDTAGFWNLSTKTRFLKSFRPPTAGGQTTIPSLREAKRRSNPERQGQPQHGLLRFARNDGGSDMAGFWNLSRDVFENLKGDIGTSQASRWKISREIFENFYRSFRKYL